LIEHSIPQIGTTVEMVLRNFDDDTQTLYLSANPSDLNETEIKLHNEFYEVIENIKEGTILSS
jgi:hypothetical protein